MHMELPYHVPQLCKLHFVNNKSWNNIFHNFFFPIFFFPIADIICCNWCIIKIASVIDPSESDFTFFQIQIQKKNK